MCSLVMLYCLNVVEIKQEIVKEKEEPVKIIVLVPQEYQDDPMFTGLFVVSIDQ